MKDAVLLLSGFVGGLFLGYLTATLKLPQGDIILRVELPARTLLQRLTGWMR